VDALVGSREANALAGVANVNDGISGQSLAGTRPKALTGSYVRLPGLVGANVQA